MNVPFKQNAQQADDSRTDNSTESQPFDYKRMTEEIGQLYLSNPQQAGKLIISYLEEHLADVPLEERTVAIDAIATHLIQPHQESQENMAWERKIISKLCSLLLNQDISDKEISYEDVLMRLSAALNTVFDSVNQIVRTMNSTLFGEQALDETIRHVISHNLSSENPDEKKVEYKSLESYLGQINDTFLITHQGFQKASRTLVKKILDELDPRNISKRSGKGLRIGPLKKAEFYSIFEEKYFQFRKWFDSGRFMEELVREFEKQCTYLKNVQKMKNNR